MNVYYARGERWEEEEKSWWNKRSKLERYLIISLIIVVLLVASLFAFFAIKNTVQTPKICITQECLLTSSQIIAHVDLDVDPCEDFFQFACGKFVEQTHGDTKAAGVWSIKDTIERQVLEILEEPFESEDHPLIKSQKKFYRACLNESAHETQALDTFKKALREMGGWPVVVGHLWKASHFDWKDMVYELRSRGYLYSMILSVVLTQDPLRANQFIIYVNVAHINVISEEQKHLYKKYMIDVAVAFGAEQALATYEAEDVLSFMEKLKNVYDKNYPAEQNKNNYNWTADMISRRLTIEEFQNDHNEIEWLDFINTLIYPAANISSNDYAIFPNSGYVKDLFQLIYRTRKRIQANYIIWRVIENVMPFMPQKLQQLEATYSCLSEKKPKSSTSQVEKCKQLAVTSFFSAPNNILYARKYLPLEKKEQVEYLSENIKSQFVDFITNSGWLDDESQDRVIQKMEETQLTVGFNDNYFNDSIFDKHAFNSIDRDEEDDGEDLDFFTQTLISKKRLINTLYSLIYLRVNDSIPFEQFGRDPVVYFESFNSIVIKAEFLQGTLYNEERPAYSNYAAIGTKIARKLMALASNALMLNDTVEETNAQIECPSEEAGDATKTENVLNYASLIVAYQAYKKWIEEHEEEAQLPGIVYAPNQLFWISSMIPQCHDLMEDQTNSDVLKALWPLQNNYDFAEDFSCTAGTKMNPPEKCQIH